MSFDNLPDISTVKELAEYLKISDQTVIRAIKAGQLKAFKIGKEWRIEKQAVLNWVKISQ
jgi:excisionase family DNA binding protein